MCRTTCCIPVILCFFAFAFLNKYSTWEHIKCGVPQGSIIGPDLFNIFINDMFYVLEQSTLHNYANDNNVCPSSDERKELLAWKVIYLI